MNCACSCAATAAPGMLPEFAALSTSSKRAARRRFDPGAAGDPPTASWCSEVLLAIAADRASTRPDPGDAQAAPADRELVQGRPAELVTLPPRARRAAGPKPRWGSRCGRAPRACRRARQGDAGRFRSSRGSEATSGWPTSYRAGATAIERLRALERRGAALEQQRHSAVVLREGRQRPNPAAASSPASKDHAVRPRGRRR